VRRKERYLGKRESFKKEKKARKGKKNANEANKTKLAKNSQEKIEQNFIRRARRPVGGEKKKEEKDIPIFVRGREVAINSIFPYQS